MMIRSLGGKRKRGLDGKFTKKEELLESQTRSIFLDDELPPTVSFFEKMKNLIALIAFLWIICFSYSLLKKFGAFEKMFDYYSALFECPTCRNCTEGEPTL